MGRHHDHSHSHSHGHGHFHGPSPHSLEAAGRHELRPLYWAFAINVTFALVELVGGLWTGSMAVLADALHDGGDSLSLGLALWLQRKSLQGPTAGFSYGYRRFSPLSALLTGAILAVGSGAVILQSVPRLAEPTQPHGPGMLLLAVIGVLANGTAALLLSRGRTLNERVLTWHMLEDVLGWVAVLFGAVLILWRDWTWVDPVLAILISGIVIFNVVKILRRSLLLFLQHTPPDVDFARLKEQLLSVPGVRDVHDLHAWSLDGHRHVLSLHAVVASKAEAPAASQLKSRLREVIARFGNFHSTIELELDGDDCADNCQN